MEKKTFDFIDFNADMGFGMINHQKNAESKK